MSVSAGTRLGPYEIVAPLGKGGMGEVWTAHDTRLGRDVAIKISAEQFSERFEREARAVAALNHPNICTLFDVGPSYLVMDFIEGTPLKGPLPLQKAIEYSGQILDALDAAHRKGITHRDLKPGNGAETILASHSSNYLCPSGISHDARWLILTEASPIHSTIVLQPHGDANKAVGIQEHDEEIDGAMSPDGRWLLYSSKPAGRREVLVQSVPKEAGGSASASGKWQISMAGGGQPTWRADGKEIFFVAPDGMMMAVPVESSANFFRPGAPKPLFRTHLEFDPPLLLGTVIGIRQYDVSADGQRFLLNQHVADSTDAPITLVVNWPRLLTK